MLLNQKLKSWSPNEPKKTCHWVYFQITYACTSVIMWPNNYRFNFLTTQFIGERRKKTWTSDCLLINNITPIYIFPSALTEFKQKWQTDKKITHHKELKFSWSSHILLALHLPCIQTERFWLEFFVAKKFNSLATSINISLKPQAWVCPLLTIPQSGIHISVSFLFFPVKIPLSTLLSHWGLPVINQSSELWHTAKLAALTWYITRAIAPTNTPEFSGGSHLIQRWCWVWSSRQKKFPTLFSNIISF